MLKKKCSAGRLGKMRIVTGCRANSDSAVVAEKLSRVRSGPTSAVNAFVDTLRDQHSRDFIPYVDPDSGGVNARILMLFQDPGPKATSKGSRMLSFSNDDQSAETMWRLLLEAAISWNDVMPWNAVPWYTGGGNSSADKTAGLRTLKPITDMLRRLEVVMTFGILATASWKRSVKEVPALRRFKHVATLHPSVRGLTRGGRQPKVVGREQLLNDLLHAKSLLR